MPITDINRRQFLKGTGTTALAGAVGAGITLTAMPTPAMAKEVPYLVDGKYDFDTVYSRVGTNCTKWDRQIQLFGSSPDPELPSSAIGLTVRTILCPGSSTRSPGQSAATISSVLQMSITSRASPFRARFRKRKTTGTSSEQNSSILSRSSPSKWRGSRMNVSDSSKL